MKKGCAVRCRIREISIIFIHFGSPGTRRIGNAMMPKSHSNGTNHQWNWLLVINDDGGGIHGRDNLGLGALDGPFGDLYFGEVGTFGRGKFDALIGDFAVSYTHSLKECDFDVLGRILGSVDKGIHVEWSRRVLEPSLVQSFGMELRHFDKERNAKQNTCCNDYSKECLRHDDFVDRCEMIFVLIGMPSTSTTTLLLCALLCCQ